MTILAAYDIHEDSRRAKVAAALQRWGDRIQFSVFVCTVEEDDYPKLIDSVKQIIDHNADSFLVLRQCSACWERKVILGQAEPTPPTLYWAVM